MYNLTSTSELISRLASQQATRDDVPQSVYVVEECSELIKELTKQQRGKSSNEKVVDEACDVLLTTIVLLKQLHVSEEDICNNLQYKLQRALDRYNKTGEI